MTTETTQEDRAAAEKQAAMEAFTKVTGVPLDPDGNAVDAEQTPPESVQPPAEPPQEEPETGGTQETQDLPEDFEQRLRWDNWAPAAIEAVRSTLSHDDLMQMYEGIEKRQSRVDRLYRERNQMARAQPEREPQEEPTAEQPQRDPSLRDVLGEKAELLGDDVVEALDGYFNERLAKLTPPPSPGPQQPDPGVEKRTQQIAAEVEANRARLAEVYPSARLDGDEWNYIVQQADVEARNPYYVQRYANDLPGAMQAIFNRVMEQEGYSVPSVNGRETTTRNGPVTRNSAATSPSQSAPPEKLTRVEMERIMFDHLRRNPGDIDGARMAVGLKPLNPHPRQIERPNRR